MIYSNACAYAIRAVTRLALMNPGGYVLLDDLTAGTDLPRHFVAKIFQDLVRKGLLTSAKGRGGGFALAHPPHKISLFDIVECVDGVDQIDQCVVGMARCDDTQPCPQHDHWKPIRTKLRDFMQETTLDQMTSTLEHKLRSLGLPIPGQSGPSKPISK